MIGEDKNFGLVVSRAPNSLHREYFFVKASLVSQVRKLSSSEPMTFATLQAFKVFRLFDDSDKSTTVSSALTLPPTTSSVSRSLGAKCDDLVVFNIEVSGAAIHLKSVESKPPLVGIDTSTRRVLALIQGNGYRFLMVGLLRPQTHSQKLSSFLQINNIRAPTGDLEGYKVAIYLSGQ